MGKFDKQKAAEDIINAALPMVVFDGWTQTTLCKAALSAGYRRTDAVRVFPNGAIEAVCEYNRMVDRKMVEELSHYNLETMKIRERIVAAVRLHLELQMKDREAVRKIVAMFASPLYAHRGLKALYETVDNIWFAIGDKSTDFNFYSKRLILAGVYSATLATWLNDHSEGFASTWEFLDRQIEGVMQFEKAKKKVKDFLAKVA